MPNITLPQWARTLRSHQVDAVQDILSAYISGSDVVFLDAPTGSGKTLIANVVHQSLAPCRTIYLCSSLSLQTQFAKDFPDAAILRGRSNYPTLDFPDRYSPFDSMSSLSCSDCSKSRNDDDEYECSWCSRVWDCPYEVAKRAAIRSDLVCTNTYYWLYEANYVGTTSGRKLVVIDECDTLESILMSFAEFNLSDRRRQEFNLPYPSKKTKEEAWVEWAVECAEIVTDAYVHSSQSLPVRPTLSRIRSHKALTTLQADFKRLVDPTYGLESGGWVYTGYNDNRIIFKPVTVNHYGREYIWKHGVKFLLMSASIISSVELAQSLGLENIQ